jgi:hypothetical protein
MKESWVKVEQVYDKAQIDVMLLMGKTQTLRQKAVKSRRFYIVYALTAIQA